MVTVGFILVVYGTAGVWLCRFLYLLVVVSPAAGAPPSGLSTR